jgi:hypothetical protein
MGLNKEGRFFQTASLLSVAERCPVKVRSNFKMNAIGNTWSFDPVRERTFGTLR